MKVGQLLSLNNDFQIVTFGPFNPGDLFESWTIRLNNQSTPPLVQIGLFREKPGDVAGYQSGGGIYLLGGSGDQVDGPQGTTVPMTFPAEHIITDNLRLICVLVDGSGIASAMRGDVWVKVWRRTGLDRGRSSVPAIGPFRLVEGVPKVTR